MEIIALRARAEVGASLDVTALPDVERRVEEGPAVVAEPDATMWLPEGWIARPEALGAWVLRRESAT